MPLHRVSALALLILLCTSTSLADVPPPSGDCMNKKEGEACKDESKRDGACGPIAYTSTNHATNPPTVTQSSYIGCRAGMTPTVTAKKCSVSTIGDATSSSPDGTEALALLVSVAYFVRRRRR